MITMLMSDDNGLLGHKLNELNALIEIQEKQIDSLYKLYADISIPDERAELIADDIEQLQEEKNRLVRARFDIEQELFHRKDRDERLRNIFH